ncbi:TPA: hypothetical protein HA351_04225 [Methanosarcinaceae archaeon]|nr:hypothetical protein [Methanosarcinaceae archaeon]
MNNLPKTLSLILAAFTVFLLLAPAGMAASIRGLPLDTNETSADEFSWGATTFGAFCYPVNKHNNFVTKGWGEQLYYEDKAGSNNGPLGSSAPGNNVIDEEELFYKTVPYSSKYTLVSELGLDTNTSEEMLGGMFYYMLPWFGRPYITVENDATQLAAVVCKQGGSDKKTIKSGESWELGKGYTLTVHQVDVDGNKVWFSLYKDGDEIESGIIETDGTVESQVFTATADFGDADDQLYFMTYVDKVFMGAVDSLAVFKYTWLIDKDNVMLIKTGDEYQGLEVDTAEASEIILTNKDTITLDLDKDKKNYFTDSWYFQTSDEGKGSSGNGYVIYPAMDVTIEDNTVSESVENDVTEEVDITPEDTDSTVDSPGSKASPVPDVRESESSSEYTEESSEQSPGFGFLTCILGLCAGFVRRK